MKNPFVGIAIALLFPISITSLGCCSVILARHEGVWIGLLNYASGSVAVYSMRSMCFNAWKNIQ